MLSAMLNTWLPVLGQQTVHTASYEASLQEFDAGNYRTALTGFLELKESQPGNVMVFYYAGRSLVELNENLADAIEYLFSAVGRGAPDDAVFYLGRAYHLDYNFSEARRYYSRFEQVASRQQMKTLRVAQMINTCRSALQITATYNQYQVMTVTFLELTDSLSYSQIKMKGGQLQRKPSDYFIMNEEREGLGSLMFMPATLQRGDYIFYAGPGKSAKDRMQLFRVKKGSGKSWGDPRELKALNTEGDELLPYFDPIESDLYFTSDGGSGIGGFDLYRSHYDVERDEWTAPINLGFPINSVMDDYLLLPGSDLGMMMFFSNRQGTDSTLTVYRVHLVEPKKRTNANDTRMLREIASLGGAAEKILAEIGAIAQQEEADGIDSQGVSGVEGTEQVALVSDSARIYTHVQILSSEEMQSAISSNGNRVLSDALMHQVASDSLKDLAVEARARVRESDDPNDRWVWQKQIMVWEKKAHDEQELANDLYTSLDEFSTDQEPAPSVNLPEPVILSAVQGEPGTQPSIQSVSSTGDNAYMNRFDILRTPPYSESNPIPVDVALPEGVFYRIQLGAYGKAVLPGTFGGISPVTAQTIKERGLIKYYAGKFTKYEDASIALSRIRSLGYEDAFISAWYDRSSISTEKAKQLE